MIFKISLVSYLWVKIKCILKHHRLPKQYGKVRFSLPKVGFGTKHENMVLAAPEI
jgi:hypothetical protein